MTTQTEKFSVPTRFVAFYSYKGGVGRTLAMANCARALAARGKKVVLLDFDLEAPGLLHFDVFKSKHGEKKSPAGFVEYLEACLQDGPPDELDSYIHECKGKNTDEGKIWLMPAGRHEEPTYSAFLNDMNWNDFYTRNDGYKILENLRGHIIECYQPDYVFIDARTGLSEIGGIATHQLADIVVLVFNLNGQNLKGAKLVFDSIRKAPLHPDVILVASPVPVMPMDKGTPFFKKMQAIKKGFFGAYNAEQPLVIPYHPLLAFDDRLLVDDGDLFSSNAPYRRLVETIQQVATVDADYYLQKMTGLIQRGDWQQVQGIALQGLAKNPTDIHLLLNLASAYYFMGMLERTVVAIDELLRHHADTVELTKQQIVAQALYNKGVTLGQLQRSEEAIAAADELLQRFGESQTLGLQERIAQALVNKGVALGQLQRGEEEIAVYNELVLRFGESQTLALQEQVANALFNKGFALDQLQRNDEAIAAYDELLQRFGESQALALQERIAQALVNKGVVLGQLQRGEEAIAAYDELTLRFGESQTLALQEQVANALFNKGVALGRLQRSEEEIAAYDELVLGFGESQTLALQEQVANALLNKGFALGQLQRNDEAIAAYDELLRRFSSSPESVLQKPVSGALNSKGFALLIKAKKVLGNSDMQHSLLQTASVQFEQASVHVAQEDRAVVLGNQSYALFLLGRTAESEQVLQEALTLGGQELYEAELADSHIDPLPEDEAFRTLIDRLWREISEKSAIKDGA
jgi:tetratricopeptide (TPR) repeat protein/MinD-like ATPase involved in chromosome partitioning or flagellar assembly